MGGQTGSTVQQTASPLQQLFAGSQGYQQMPAGPVSSPQSPVAPQTPEQAAQATIARMLARTPAQPAPAVQKPAETVKVPYRDIR
jgi:hypothetical protein